MTSQGKRKKKASRSKFPVSNSIDLDADHKVIAHIYDAAVDPMLWKVVLETIAGPTAAAGHLYSYDPKTPQMGFLVTFGLDEKMLSDYRQHYVKGDVVARKAREMAAGTAGPWEELVPRAEHERSEMFNDWLRPQELLWGYGANAITEPDRHFGVAVFGSARRGEFARSDYDRILRFVPHLRRAAEIHRRVSTLTVERNFFSAALEQFGGGVAFLSDDGALIFANLEAESILRRGDGLRLLPDKRISSIDPADEKRFATLINSSLPKMLTSPSYGGGFVRIRRTGNQTPYEVLVTPVQRNPFDLASSRHASVALYVRDPTHELPSSEQVLTSLYGMTPAEARVAIALSRGLSPQEIADQQGTSTNTVRFQLKQAMSKTDTRRQAELVRLVIGSLGMFSHASDFLVPSRNRTNGGSSK